MTAVLICTHSDVEADLAQTLLYRHDVDRHLRIKMDDARMLAVAAQPRLVLIDRDLPWAARFVTALREDAATRGLSLVVMARGDFDPSEVDLLEAGANAILRLPAGPEWNERLQRLMDVPVRKDARFPVSFRVDTLGAGDDAAPAQALNLSASGMLLEAVASLSVGDEVELQFRLPDSERVLRARGRVMRIATPGQFGMEFQAPAAEDVQHIQRFLDTLGPR